MEQFNAEYWDNLFKNAKIGWDLGYPAPALTEYFEQIQNKDIKILIPGAGNAYEVEYLFKKKFSNVYLLDFSKEAVKLFKNRCPEFPDNKIIIDDFFVHQGKYDLIIEQTFFTSFVPEKRYDFIKKVFDLLNDGGKYVGLFFTHEFGKSFPPFGATKKEYKQLLVRYFNFKVFEIAYNSIKPRKNREYFFIMQKKTNR